ncbi:MAG: PLP-dependent transferase, partial [Halobacteriales archaeon]|nr:PLP-dependent transferase [Halobacteriales archaeon]
MGHHDLAFATRAIHAGQRPDPSTGAVMTPIYATSTYAHDTPGQHRGYSYARSENPTRAALEANIASLEGGSHGRAFASGMAAIDAACSLLSPGDHVVTGEGVYGGTRRLFDQVYRRRGLEVSYVELTDLDAIEAAFRDETALLWLESPTNPLLDIIDLSGAATIARDHDALTVVDNTFATP